MCVCVCVCACVCACVRVCVCACACVCVQRDISLRLADDLRAAAEPWDVAIIGSGVLGHMAVSVGVLGHMAVSAGVLGHMAVSQRDTLRCISSVGRCVSFTRGYMSFKRKYVPFIGMLIIGILLIGILLIARHVTIHITVTSTKNRHKCYDLTIFFLDPARYIS